MYEISVTARFNATHHLRMPDGSVEPPHGHDWRVVVTCAGPRLDDCGLLLDFHALETRLGAILAEFRDADLNTAPALAGCNPSAEHVARHIAQRITANLPAGVSLTCVELEESPGCVARYRPEA